MTLDETIKKISSLQHLVGKPVPRWESPILEMIPAPTNGTFTTYMELYKKTGKVDTAISKTKPRQFDILIIFRTPGLHLDLVYEWYSFFYG
jgi:hypothetical protein